MEFDEVALELENINSSKQWLERVAQNTGKFPEEVVGKVLQEYFHEPADNITELLHDMLDWDANKFARVLIKVTKLPGPETAALLLNAGFPILLAKAAITMILPGVHIDARGGHLDEGGKGHIDEGGKGHIDEGGKGHIDEGGKGHIDDGGKGHIDTRLRFLVGSKHINTKAIPHVNTKAIPHVNTKAIPHINTKAIPHVNTNAIPHVNQSLHIDTK